MGIPLQRCVREHTAFDLLLNEVYDEEEWNRHGKLEHYMARLMLEVRKAPWVKPNNLSTDQLFPKFDVEYVQPEPISDDQQETTSTADAVKHRQLWERAVWCARLGVDARTGKKLPDYQELEKQRWLEIKRQRAQSEK